MFNILVICVGNICRSPICEGLFNERLKNIDPDIRVSSAGLSALVGRPADKLAQELMLEKNIDISAHRARQINSEILLESDIIFTMTNGQQTHLEGKIPHLKGRLHRLGEIEGYDVPDPYKRPKAAFEQALLLIDQAVDNWCKVLWK